MYHNYRFPSQILQSVIGGVSPIDIPRLEVRSWEEAYEFAITYGYDLKKKEDLDEVWGMHAQAIGLLRDRLLDPGEEIPETLANPSKLQDPLNLLLLASTQEHKDNQNQRWSCAILRIMHVLSHLEDDLFAHFTSEIQEQVLKPIQAHVVQDPVGGVVLGLQTDQEQIPLKNFEIKPSKSHASSAIKLLAKPEAVALGLMDRVGVRFITKDVFDAFRVVRFLVDEHLISFPHIIATQVRNNLYPTNLFLETMTEVEANKEQIRDDALIDRLQKKLNDSLTRAEFKEKLNEFSGQDYRSIKFIIRKLIQTHVGDRPVHFFYPYEVQVVDYDTHLKNLSGPQAHEEYKKRQREAARRRVLGHLAEKKA